MYTLITGATSGIGYEFAKLMAKNKKNILLISRNEDKLKLVSEKLSDINKDIIIHYLAVDLSVAGAAKKVFEWTSNNSYSVELLINNAGFGSYGKFYKMDFDNETAMIDLNIRSLVQLTMLYLPNMVEMNRGGVINMASAAAFSAGPYMSNYYATKAYVLSFTEAISEELKGTNVSVVAVCPGPINTNFQSRANVNRSKLSNAFTNSKTSAYTIAKSAYSAYLNKKVICIPEFKYKIIAALSKIAPRFISRKVMGFTQRENN